MYYPTVKFAVCFYTDQINPMLYNVKQKVCKVYIKTRVLEKLFGILLFSWAKILGIRYHDNLVLYTAKKILDFSVKCFKQKGNILA